MNDFRIWCCVLENQYFCYCINFLFIFDCLGYFLCDIFVRVYKDLVNMDFIMYRIYFEFNFDYYLGLSGEG